MKKAALVFLMAVLAFASLTPHALAANGEEPAFADIRGHWAKASIEMAAKLGLVAGEGNQKFNPNGKLTREAFVSLLVRAAGDEVKKDLRLAEQTPFADVASNRWSAKDIQVAVSLGWINPSDFPGQMFRPAEELTREEAASYLRAFLFGNADDLKNIRTTVSFQDDANISADRIRDVHILAELGILSGSNGRFNPKNTLTRAEMVIMITRALAHQLNTLAYLSNLAGDLALAQSYAKAASGLATIPASTALLAAAHYGLGDYEKAEELFAKAYNDGYNNPYALSMAAMAAFQRKDYAKAAEHQRKAVQALSSDPFQVYLAALMEGAGGNLLSALANFNKARTLDSDQVFEEDIQTLMNKAEGMDAQQLRTLLGDAVEIVENYQAAVLALISVSKPAGAVSSNGSAAISVYKAVKDSAGEEGEKTGAMAQAAEYVAGLVLGSESSDARKLLIRGCKLAANKASVTNILTEQLAQAEDWNQAAETIESILKYWE